MKAIGQAVIWGVRPLRPIVNIPPDAKRTKVKMKNESFVRAFVQFDDRIEQWMVTPSNNDLNSPTWTLGVLQAVNHRQRS